MRQLRVRSDACRMPDSLRSYFVSCYDDYSPGNEEQRSFEPGWIINLTRQASTASVARAFQYRTSQQLDTYPFAGKHHTYPSGGYVFEFRGRLAQLQGNLSQLRQMNWIDGQTRAVLIQLTLYNPNVHLFTSVSLLAEFLSTGGVETLSKIQPMSLQSKTLVSASL